MSHVSKQSSPVVPQQKRRFFISHILASDLHNLIHMPIRNHEVHVPIVVVVDEVGSKAYVRHCECCQPGLTSTVFVAEGLCANVQRMVFISEICYDEIGPAIVVDISGIHAHPSPGYSVKAVSHLSIQGYVLKCPVPLIN